MSRRPGRVVAGPADSVGGFLGWCVAGAALCLGVLSILTIGPFVLLIALVLCAGMLWRQGFGSSLTGLVSGAAAPLLYVAWLNRGGPGEVCRGDDRALSCTDEWSPWPFVAVAAALLVAGLVLFLRLRRR
jgi:MYXO-CTERM domain-containing protein